jgi:hypothetical protein
MFARNSQLQPYLDDTFVEAILNGAKGGLKYYQKEKDKKRQPVNV